MPDNAKSASKMPQKILHLVAYLLLILCFAAVAIIFSQLIVGLLMIPIIGMDNFTQPVWTAVYSALSYVLAMIIIIIVPNLIAPKIKHLKKFDWADLGLNRLPTWTDIGLAPVAFIVYAVLAAVIVWLFSFFPWFDAEQAQDVGFNVLTSGLDRVVAFMTLVVVAPIAEEIIFRGWLYAKLKYRFLRNCSERTAIILSTLLVSVLFGALHMQWNVGVNVFVMSLVMCALREINGTIYAGILMHMLKNGVAFYILYMLGIG